ncbi:MAG: DUF5916 domain-containing protein, partial [Gemmatimonadales bacterium]
MQLAFLALVFALQSNEPVFAQSPEVATLSYAGRISGPVGLDGVPDEAAWDGVPTLPLTMYEPVFMGEATERTEVQIGYDDNYLYVAGRLYDSHPEGIRINTLYRDRWSGDDTFGVIIDAFNDNESAVWFFTTPAGIRVDASISNDAEGRFNMDWNSFWDVASRVTNEGWFAEFRIPFSSLGFQSIDGATTMGFTVYRFIGRKNERHIFPSHSPAWAFRKPSRFQDVILEGVHAQKPIYVTPYLLGGVEQRSELNGPETAFELNDDRTTEIGGDLRYSLTTNLRLDLTVNTDFAQVEADDQQVNLTRFSLFFPEKRQFFQERQTVFEFGLGDRDRLFHSRRIGLSSGTPVRILGGARVVGRVGSWDVGLLNMQTARQDDLAAENFGVLRIRRQAFNDNSYVGAMVTTRVDEDGGYNVGYGIDGTIRVWGDDYLRARWTQTFDEELIAGDEFELRNAGAMFLNLERRLREGFRYELATRWFGSDFRPDMGFVTREDFYQMFGRIQYDDVLGEGSPFRRVRPFNVTAWTAHRNGDGSIESAEISQQAELEWKNSARFQFEVKARFEDLSDTLNLPEGTFVPIGDYWFAEAQVTYNMSRNDRLRISSNATVGTFYDGWRFRAKVSPNWTLSRHLQVSGEYEANVVRFGDRNFGFTSHIGRFRTQIALDNRFSLTAFVQFSSAADLVSTNVRFRYNVREGNDLWIVYDEGVNLDLT